VARARDRLADRAVRRRPVDQETRLVPGDQRRAGGLLDALDQLRRTPPVGFGRDGVFDRFFRELGRELPSGLDHDRRESRGGNARLRAAVPGAAWDEERATRWWERHRPLNGFSEECVECDMRLMPALTSEPDAVEQGSGAV
jgi:hypothetical protein